VRKFKNIEITPCIISDYSRIKLNHKMEETQINKIKEEKGGITTNTNKIQTIIRETFENLYLSELKKLEEMDVSRCIKPSKTEPKIY
jgi:hypothetical protein